MTQPENDAARLARDIADGVNTVACHWLGRWPLYSKRIKELCDVIQPRLRAHLAERDARMVREAAEAVCDWQVPDLEAAVCRLREVLYAAKSDEQAKSRDLSHDELKKMALPPPQEWLEEEWNDPTTTEPSQ